MLTTAEVTWLGNNVPDVYTTITSVVFSAQDVTRRKDITLCSMIRGVMNRADRDDTLTFGGLYYESVSVNAYIVADLQAFIEGSGEPCIYPAGQTDLIPRNSRWQFRRVLDIISVWDISTGTWNAALNDTQVKAELNLLFDNFGMSGENGWERLFRYESGLRLQDDNSLSYPDPCIPTSGNGIVHPVSWNVAAVANNHRFDTLTFYYDVLEDDNYLNSTRSAVDGTNPDGLDQVGIAIRNVQGYDQINVPPDQIMSATSDYRMSELDVGGFQSFRQFAVIKAVEANPLITWP